MKFAQFTLSAVLLCLSSNLLAANTADNSDIGTITALTFHDNILFAADSDNGIVFALKTSDTPKREQPVSYSVKDLSSQIAEQLNVKPGTLLFKDLAVHPITGEAYIAVAKIAGDRYTPEIFVVNAQGEIKTLDINEQIISQLALESGNENSFEFWSNPIKQSQHLTVTDLDFHKDKLYISGLNNTDFSSTLRVAEYPFNDKIDVANIEIFHANHNQDETRAPIRTMIITEIDGEDYVLAAYTCTPLVVFPVSEIKDGAQITGRTIAELGYGNTPLDLIEFEAQDFEQNKFDAVLLNNKNQSAQLMLKEDIVKAANSAPLTEFVYFQNAGVPTHNVPMTATIQIAELDPAHLIALRRNLDTGEVELVSYLKNLYFRLSDFESEYEFPDYEYGEGQEVLKSVQNMMKADEGFEEKVIE